MVVPPNLLWDKPPEHQDNYMVTNSIGVWRYNSAWLQVLEHEHHQVNVFIT